MTAFQPDAFAPEGFGTMAQQTFTWGEFADPANNALRAKLFVDYDDVSLEVQRLRVENPTSVGAQATIRHNDGTTFTDTVPAGQNASRNLPNNKYFLVADDEGGIGTGPWSLGFRAV